LIPEGKAMEERRGGEEWFRLRKWIRARLKRNPFHLRKWESFRDSLRTLARQIADQLNFVREKSDALTTTSPAF
jgi:hypothetical protein